MTYRTGSNTLKVGDSVTCIDPRSGLTLNAIYTIEDTHQNDGIHFVSVRDDTGRLVEYYASRFELAETLNLPDWF